MKRILLIIICIITFSCSKEKETEVTISITYNKDAESYTFALPGVADYELKIFSKSGSPIFTSKFTTTSANKNFTWDGKTSDGNKVADGVYTYIIKSTSDDSLNQDGFVYVLSK
jgi:flagellar hook assembly protein FlgD